jgi:D-glycero-D-manno-heptose 1,7-bisphosphate phosphatase
MKNKCVFLDRDGVLNADDQYYTYRLEDVVVLEGVAEALKRLKDAGYLLIVVTNQAGIGKGQYGPDEVSAVHQKIQEETGHLLDDLYFSPHHPDYSSRSLRRKPDSLMLEKATAKYNIDPVKSWMIGDKVSDVAAGRKVGAKTIYIGQKEAEGDFGDYQAENLLAAAEIILR